MQVNQIIRIVQGSGIIGIENNGTELPEGFKLEQNYPNPFNPATNIRFSIPNMLSNRDISLTIYNILGIKVALLASGKYPAGVHEAVWDASESPSGIYFYKLLSENLSITKKMFLVK